MARARNIKPSFFANEELAECDPLARLLFAGLWCLADRDGRLEDRPKRIRAELLPYDACDADDLLNQLQSRGFILRYAHGERRFIQVLKFSQHQNPHIKEAKSTIPAPDSTGSAHHSFGEELVHHHTSTVLPPDEHHESPADSLISDSLISDSNKQHPASAGASADDCGRVVAAKRSGKSYTQEFEQAWSAYPQRPNNSKADAFKAWNARIRAGASPGNIIAGVERYAAYCKTDVSDPRYIKQAATFFGPAEHYLEEWRPTARGAPPGKPGGVRHNGFNGVDYRKGVNDDGTFD